MRLIDADKALSMAEDIQYACYDMYDLPDFLAAVPTVDAVPVVHGTWLNKEQTFTHNNMTFSGKYPTCSLCGQIETGLEQKTKFCPGCGALMDGGNADAKEN